MQWSEFRNIVCSAFEGLRNDHELTDVTLVCKDGEQLEAHKIVLASCSPFFMQLFKKNKHPHPLIYLRGIGVEDLVTMIEFLYTGEAKVGQENLEEFIATAKELKIKGVLDEEESMQNQPDRNETPKKIRDDSEKKLLLNSSGLPQSEDIDDKPSVHATTKTMAREYNKKSSVRSYFNESTSNSSECKLCGKEVQTKGGNTTGLWRHMEIAHEDTEVRQGVDKIRRKEHSLVWGYFQKLSDEKCSAMCNICERLVGFKLN